MKNGARCLKPIGFVCLFLAFVLLIAAVYGHVLNVRPSERYSAAQSQNALILAYKTASSKTAPSAVKTAAAAVSAAQSAQSDSEKALEEAEKLARDFDAGKLSDPIVQQALDASKALSALTEESGEAWAQSVQDAAESLEGGAQSALNALLTQKLETAYKSVSSAESRAETAQNGIADVYSALQISFQPERIEKTKKETPGDREGIERTLQALCARAQELNAFSKQLTDEAQNAQARADALAAGTRQSFGERLLLMIGSNPIGFSFTAALLLLIGCTLAFFSAWFMRMWRRHMLFSTFVALIVMIVIQVYALGFRFESYGAWALYWLKNMLNVLRSNSSVGMIALGMTFVIITGGIDLAVGSTLAGVATVVMVCLDVSGRGFLTNAGITDTPNFLIAILAGLLTGAGLGALTGLGITKGRIPPFIITLGVMNIVRSVAQYFTKSYKPEVPKAFQVIANKEIIGDQMLLPILYWLALAAVMYIISRHTAFGRHIYAVGSNEKASRLSGINVNRVKMGVYMLMGVIVAIAAITSVARLRGVDVASAGSGFEMNAIAAVVVGGTSMAGGRGSILGTVFGVLIIGIMNNLLVLVGVDAFLSNAFTGAIIIFAVLIQKKDRG